MPTGVNQTLSSIEKIFKDAVWDPLIMTGEVALFTAVPVLNAPVLGAIDKEVISLASDWLFKQFVLFVDVTYVKFKNEAAQKQWDKDSLELEITLQTSGADSDAYKKALQIAIAAQVAITRVSQ